MNNVNLIGNITKDIELRHTNDNKPVCGFCVAVAAGNDKAYFIDCVAWGDKAETIAKNFKKGDKIGITGSLSSRMFEYEGQKRKAVEVIVSGFDFCTGRKPEQDQSGTVGNLPFEI